jgi:hypothetical protein
LRDDDLRDDDLPYVYRWDRMGRKGQRCRVLVRGAMNSCLVQNNSGKVTALASLAGPEAAAVVAASVVRLTTTPRRSAGIVHRVSAEGFYQ